MYSKQFRDARAADIWLETSLGLNAPVCFDYAGASLYRSYDDESASLQTVLVLDHPIQDPEPGHTILHEDPAGMTNCGQ